MDDHEALSRREPVTTLQSAAVATGLVFSWVLLVAIYSMKRAFDHELLFIDARMPAPPTARLAAEAGARMRAEAIAEEEAALEELEAAAEAAAKEHGTI